MRLKNGTIRYVHRNVFACIVLTMLTAIPLSGRPLTFIASAGASGCGVWGQGWSSGLSELVLKSGIDSSGIAGRMTPLYTFTGGLGVSLTLSSSLALDGTLWYRQKGCGVSQIRSDTTVELSLTYLTFPLTMRWTLPGTGLVFPYLYAGGYAGLMLDASYNLIYQVPVNDFGRSFKRRTVDAVNMRTRVSWYDAGVIAGGGVELGLGIRGILLDGCCELGLADIGHYENVTSLFTGVVRTLTIHLTAGYEIRFISL